MAYKQDTIISANAANVFANVLTGLLVDAGWTLVETLSPAGTFTPTTKVYKSSGGSNQCGYDWYLAVMYKQTGTEAQVRIIGGGAYDTSTKIISQIPANTVPVDTGSNRQYAEAVTGDMWGGYNVNVATNTNTSVSSNRSAAPSQAWPFFSVIVPSSAFGYWMSVTLDHVAIFTTIPASYVVGTLNIDPAYSALNAASFGNGVATNPVVGYTQNAAPVIAQFSGISATVKGVPGTPSSANQISPRARRAGPYGSLLPAITGNYLPAYAWRDAWYLASLDYLGKSAGGSPVWDDTGLGGGIHIGDSIDWYMVYGGSIGDTVEIAGATYVLSGLITGSAQPDLANDYANPGVYVAVLVEA